MIASMTGFARRELSGPWGSLVCELRSVNHRFLESGFRLPEELRSVESDLRQHLGQALRRGKLDCTIIYRPAQAAAMTLEVDAAALERLTSRLDELQRVIPLGSVDLLEVLR
ncbi:protein containing YicC-like protein, partial [mine drainage metagenome]